MAFSSSSRRKWKVSWIARNVNATGRISDEDIRRKLFSIRKIKTVVSHRYLKLVSVLYSNLKMSDETFCNTIKGVDMKLIKEVWIGIVVFQPITKEGFLFQIWIGHQGNGRPSKTHIGPLTRAMAKRIQEEEGSPTILLLWKNSAAFILLTGTFVVWLPVSMSLTHSKLPSSGI
ncbi:hypothetical protein LR48_Vigan03g070400 [Vigna angularis]|uniref:Uncharacterized protein n=1 Tax=Phaseolus angularis TaxID=3914 RepID=A0A0L9U3C4_PHAAN|nr:hypothetical protein LR48_Vigan03g070400 [Vigna angularis]